ncbi:MAG: peptidylprolyl isomerase, partial [Arenicellales bacterium]
MLVRVNRVVIGKEAINLESAHVEEGSIEERREEAARRLVIRELLRQRAEAAGISPAGGAEDAIEELLSAEVDVPGADEEACRRYFESNRERFHSPEEVELRHILLAAAPDDSGARVRQRDAAESLLAKLEEDLESFDELARRHSHCPSAEQ